MMQRVERPDPDVVTMVAAAVLREGKVLVMRERDEPYNGQWVVPQGYVKSRESLLEAAKREVREELGLDIAVKGLLGVYEDFINEGGRTMHIITVCFVGTEAGKGGPRASPEAVDFAWIDPSQQLNAFPRIVQRMLLDVKRRTRKFAGVLT